MAAGRGTLLLVALLIGLGCAEQTTQSEGGNESFDAAAGDASAMDTAEVSVEVLDDERSLERRIKDASIATEIRLALVEAKDLRRFDFDPVVVNGRVHLRGEVATREQRSRAEAVAEGVGGVREVVNEITSSEQPALAEAETEDTSTDTSGDDPDAPSATASSQPGTSDSESRATDGESEETDQQATHHTVQSGESLWTISRKYGVTVDQIKRLNNLRSNSIKPGQRLRVK